MPAGLSATFSGPSDKELARLPSIVFAKRRDGEYGGYEVEDIDTREILSSGQSMKDACESLWRKLGVRPTMYRTSLNGNFFCFPGHENRLLS